MKRHTGQSFVQGDRPNSLVLPVNIDAVTTTYYAKTRPPCDFYREIEASSRGTSSTSVHSILQCNIIRYCIYFVAKLKR